MLVSISSRTRILSFEWNSVNSRAFNSPIVESATPKIVAGIYMYQGALGDPRILSSVPSSENPRIVGSSRLSKRRNGLAFSAPRLLFCAARILESPNRRFSGICRLFSGCFPLPFPEVTGEIHTISRQKPFNPFRCTRSERGNGEPDSEGCDIHADDDHRSTAAARRSPGIFTVLFVADSLSQFPGCISAGSEYRETLGEHHHPLHPRHASSRESPVCKKELSSNRINDPLASIYRARRRLGCAGMTGRAGTCIRTNSSNCLRGTRSAQQLFLRLRRVASSFCRARRNIICFLAVPGSLCRRRRKFNRALEHAYPLSPPDASVNPVFGAYNPLARGCRTSQSRATSVLVPERKYIPRNSDGKLTIGKNSSENLRSKKRLPRFDRVILCYILAGIYGSVEAFPCHARTMTNSAHAIRSENT